MSSEVNFFCDFCKEQIVAGTANRESIGYVLKRESLSGERKWKKVTHKDDFKGPHICNNCLESLWNSEF